MLHSFITINKICNKYLFYTQYYTRFLEKRNKFLKDKEIKKIRGNENTFLPELVSKLKLINKASLRERTSAITIETQSQT